MAELYIIQECYVDTNLIILKCAKEEKVEMKQFDLSDELRSFTAQTK